MPTVTKWYHSGKHASILMGPHVAEIASSTISQDPRCRRCGDTLISRSVTLSSVEQTVEQGQRQLDQTELLVEFLMWYDPDATNPDAERETVLRFLAERRNVTEEAERQGQADPTKPDRYGRIWPFPKNELCPECGQPDSVGDCNHERLSDEDVQTLLPDSELRALHGD